MKILIMIVLMFSFCFVLNAEDKKEEDTGQKIANAETYDICTEPGKCPCPEPNKGDRRPGKVVSQTSEGESVVPEAVEEK
ncbi:MAG: hypothetical protein KAQ98_00360 [Bacteriovoracaceae bacterium]|nr:hypothetical protein [Bacteriovoracaceae bacterium]